MSGTTISTFVTHTILLGDPGKASRLTIARTGDVIAYTSADGSAAGTVGVLATGSGVFLVNHGNADGNGSGYTAATGVDFMSGGDTLINTGGISAGSSTYATLGVKALDGVDIFGGKIENAGTILGGSTGLYYAVTGSSGIAAEAGGLGVALDGGSRMTSSGTIFGGAGGRVESSHGAQSGTGGAGVLVGAGSSAENTGKLKGGAGGSGPFGGRGGVGADVEGGNLFNRGFIGGGSGGQAYAGGFGSLAEGGAGGTGLLLNGGVVHDFGTIAGGAGGTGATSTGSAGAAVQFGAAASTLDIGASAVFEGGVVANPGADDVLGLVGTATGTLTGLGSAFTGFSTIREAAGAHWTLSGHSVLQAADLDIHGSLTLLGAVSGSGSLHLASGAVVVVQGSLSLTAIAFRAGGNETLGLSTSGSITSVVDHFRAGDTIDMHGVVSELTYQDGTLTLAGAGFSEQLQLSGQYEQSHFALSGDGSGGTDVTYGVPSSMQESVVAPPSNWHTNS